jgi:phosphoglycolate phosphatase
MGKKQIVILTDRLQINDLNHSDALEAHSNPDHLIPIFDLDGTLWDTSESCAVAWNNVLRRNAIDFREIVADDLRRVTGSPHEDCIRMVFRGLSERDIAVLIRETMSEDNKMVSQFGGNLYPGVSDGLKVLAKRSPLFLVSNCQTGYIEAFVNSHGFEGLFRDYECWGNTGKSKTENLSDLIDRNDIRSPVYIGDTFGDFDAAMNLNIPFIQVTYGFGDPISECTRISRFSDLVGLFIVGST